MVIDLSEIASYTVGEKTRIAFRTSELSPGDVLDVAYVAFADSIEALKEVVKDTTYADYGKSLNNMPAERNTDDDSCVGHRYVKIADETDPKGYVIGCPCGEVSLTVNGYFTEGGVHIYDVPGTDVDVIGNKTQMYDEDGGFYFNRFTVDAEAANSIFDLLTTNGDSSRYASYSEEIKSGKYVAIKLRGKFEGDRALYIGTKDNDPNGAYHPVVSSLGKIKKANISETDWMVIVIDLSEVTNYTVGINTQIAFRTGEMSPGEVLDVAYVVFADSIASLKDVVKDSTYIYYGTSLDNVPGERNTEDDSCVQHTMDFVTETVAEGTKYSYECTGCGEEAYYRIFPASASFVLTGADFANGMNAWYNTEHTFVEEQGLVYGRWTVADGGGENIFMRAQEDYKGETGSHLDLDPVDVGQAKYLVYRMKISDSSKSMNVYLSTSGNNGVPTANIGSNDTPKAEANCYAYVTIPTSAVTAGQWATYVLDLSVIEEHWSVDPVSGKYMIDTLMFAPNGNTTYEVEYITFVETWADVKLLADEEETVILANTATATYTPPRASYAANASATDVVCDQSGHGAVVQAGEAGHYTKGCFKCDIADSAITPHTNEEGVCPACGYSCVSGHTADLTKAPAGSADGEGNTVYTYTCSKCSGTAYTKTVPDSIGCFITSYDAIKDLTSSKSLHSYTNADGKVCAVWDGNSGEMIFERNPDDHRGTTWGSTALGSAFDVGMSKYLVIRMKVTNNRTDGNADGLQLHISSTGKQAVKSSTNGFARINITKTGLASNPNTDWQVYVIDLEACFGDYWAVDPTSETYKVDSFWFGPSLNCLYNVEYLAFAETWADIDAIVDEESVLYTDLTVEPNDTGIRDMTAPGYTVTNVQAKVASELES